VPWGSSRGAMGNTVCGAGKVEMLHCCGCEGSSKGILSEAEVRPEDQESTKVDSDVEAVVLPKEEPEDTEEVPQQLWPVAREQEPAPTPPGAEEELERFRSRREEEYQQALEETKRSMREDPVCGARRPANRYGTEAELPPFESTKHVPVIALLNPMSGAMAGMDIMQIARRTPYYKDRFFDIVEVVKGQRRGGLMDLFRSELNRAKDDAKAMGTRPRLISGGGDGTGSFAVFMIFLTLKADDDRKEDGLADTGNGFIWTDVEMQESFPALAQMPLGSANDFGNILGWGQKYPGQRCGLCTSRELAAAALSRWMAAAIDPNSKLANFDIWGIMPAPGEETCNFKIAELTGKRGSCPNVDVDGLKQLQLKQAGKPVPFFVMLYFSAGFGAYMTARFQINRRNTPLKNRAEYVRQALGIIREAPPPQLHLRLNGVEIDCEERPYFPPRRDEGVQGRGYREVGFYNINWQAHLMHGADRASVTSRLTSSRAPVSFNDGFMDMYRWKFMSILKNPGLRIQTDKKKDLLLTFKGQKGKGVFFQWDGEARFAFSASGNPFNIYIRRVLSVPVVLGPFLNTSLTGDLDNGREVSFEFAGETQEEKDQTRRRVLQSVGGELDKELIASREEILAANLRLFDPSEEEEPAEQKS